MSTPTKVEVTFVSTSGRDGCGLYEDQANRTTSVVHGVRHCIKVARHTERRTLTGEEYCVLAEGLLRCWISDWCPWVWEVVREWDVVLWDRGDMYRCVLLRMYSVEEMRGHITREHVQKVAAGDAGSEAAAWRRAFLRMPAV